MPFDKSKIPKDEDLLDFKSVIDDDEDSDVPEIPRESHKISRDENNNNSSNNSNKTIIIVCACVLASVLIIVFGVIALNKYNDRKEREANEAAWALQQAQDRSSAVATSTVSAGAPDVYSNSTKANNTLISDSSKITHGLNGEEVDTNYKINKITTVRDFINYEKYRATTAEGLEFYWLEVTYKSKPYKVQVPYKIFKELEDTGVTLADVEVTFTDTGAEIITYMNVVENAKTIINKK